MHRTMVVSVNEAEAQFHGEINSLINGAQRLRLAARFDLCVGTYKHGRRPPAGGIAGRRFMHRTIVVSVNEAETQFHGEINSLINGAQSRT